MIKMIILAEKFQVIFVMKMDSAAIPSSINEPTIIVCGRALYELKNKLNIFVQRQQKRKD